MDLCRRSVFTRDKDRNFHFLRGGLKSLKQGDVFCLTEGDNGELVVDGNNNAVFVAMKNPVRLNENSHWQIDTEPVPSEDGVCPSVEELLAAVMEVADV
jgi:hypothetical protein